MEKIYCILVLVMSVIKVYEEDIENKITSLDKKDTVKFLKKNNKLEYHYFLSSLRYNLFKWYPFKQQGTLLEIGAGYGQLTGLFTQKVNNVTAVEDSKTKAEIISKRAKNAQVIVCDFDKLDIDDKFDYIILCNTFEYAKSFWDSEHPYEDYLKYLKNYLKEDGVILLALSNRIGLKYFAGFKEEHTQQLFSGIDGFINDNPAETFTKHELIEIIHSAGFDNYKFFYPYPDHKFPNVIHTDMFVNEKPYCQSSEYFDKRYDLFREDRLNQTLARDNLAGFFSNSFLVEIRNSKGDYPSDDIDYVSLNFDRKDEFKSLNIISNEKVSKIKLSGNFNYLEKNIDTIFGKIRYLPCEMSEHKLEYQYKAKSVESQLIQAIYSNDRNGFLNIIKKYYEALFYNSSKSKYLLGDEFKSVFKVTTENEFHFHSKSSLDLTLDNVYAVNDEYFTTGYEWLFEFPIPLEYIFYRVINHQINRNVLFKDFISVVEIFNFLNLSVGDIELFEQWEREFSKYAFDTSVKPKTETVSKENLDFTSKMDEYLISSYILEHANYNRTEQLKRDIVINQRNIIKQKNDEIARKNKQIQNKNRQIRRKNKKIKEYADSTSWKITKPLRKLASMIKR